MKLLLPFLLLVSFSTHAADPSDAGKEMDMNAAIKEHMARLSQGYSPGANLTGDEYRILLRKRQDNSRTTYHRYDDRFEGSKTGICDSEGYPIDKIILGGDSFCLTPLDLRRIRTGTASPDVIWVYENDQSAKRNAEMMIRAYEKRTLEAAKSATSGPTSDSPKTSTPESAPTPIKDLQAVKAFDADLQLEVIVGSTKACKKDEYFELYRIALKNFRKESKKHVGQLQPTTFFNTPTKPSGPIPCQIHLLIDVPMNYQFPAAKPTSSKVRKPVREGSPR